MPIYEYRREDGTTFDVIQKFDDEPLAVDPETGQKVQKVFSSVAIHFKGSGFHNTDYGSKRRQRSDGVDALPSSSESTGSAGSKSDSKSDSKPTVKSDSKSDKGATKKPNAKTASPT